MNITFIYLGTPLYASELTQPISITTRMAFLFPPFNHLGQTTNNDPHQSLHPSVHS